MVKRFRWSMIIVVCYWKATILFSFSMKTYSFIHRYLNESNISNLLSFITTSSFLYNLSSVRIKQNCKIQLFYAAFLKISATQIAKYTYTLQSRNNLEKIVHCGTFQPPSLPINSSAYNSNTNPNTSGSHFVNT
jgi:hypothetical protein